MRFRILPILLAACPVATATLRADVPRALDEGAEISLFAGSDLIPHPTGIAFTRDGKLLAIQSNTHFRPEEYEGPASDRIVWLEDSDGDGAADRSRVFFESDLVATMDIATHPDTGAIYVATRNEILRLWDENGDGVADPDRVERRLVFLETEGTYPHNGCSGLTFDDEGNVIFGVGENLGVDYTLIGSDDRKISDGGEGGNIWWCRADGSSLTRFATGFWNPFGICHARGGFLFATDNDPSSRPPSRLHFVIYGGDYGYQYRYGRSGHHPFISWDGELPGTLPMLHGTGEAPCDVIHVDGHLYVASWADRRIERYPLGWNRTHFEAVREVVVRSEGDFRPVGLAVGPDGALYCSDWVRSDYQLHGEGRVWKIEGWKPPARPMPGPEARVALMRAPVEDNTVAEPYWRDPWLAPALIGTLAKDANSILGLHRPDPADPDTDARQRALMMLAWRKSNPEDPTGLAAECLSDPDPTVRLLALKWIADEKLESDRAKVEAIANNPPSPVLFHAAVTALARIDGKPVGDKDIQDQLGARLKRADVSPAVKRAAFRVLADRENFLDVGELRELYRDADEELRIEIMITMLTHPNRDGARAFAREVRQAEDTSHRVKRFAREVASPPASPVVAEVSRPPVDNLAAWWNYLGAIDDTGRSDTAIRDRGRIVFHRHCAACHRVDGFGKQGAPDLSTIHERGQDHLLESILVPGAEVAPQYEPWQLTLKDRSELVGFLLGQKGGKSIFADIAGNEFSVDYRDIVSRRQVAMSLMPPGLVSLMTDEEISDLLFWLGNPRP